MAQARYLCAILVLSGAGLRAEEPESAAATSATSLNQSLAIEEPAPSPAGDAASSAVESTQVPKSQPMSTALERPPIYLGKKRFASEVNPFDAAATTQWYRSSLGAMGIVLGLIVAFFLVLRRWSPSLKSSGSGIVQVVGRTVLGPRQSFVLVQLGQRLVLVGVSADRMERICEIADAAEVSTLLAESRRVRGDFSTWLDRESAEFARSGAKESGETETEGSAPGNLAQLLRKLRTTRV